MMLIAAMCGVIFFMVRRHRRLSNNFSRFANSHYDTKTGTTRIGNEDDIHDIRRDNGEEINEWERRDNDNINNMPGFDDDEPLVVT